MNMTCDIYVQKNVQTKSGVVTRQWIYEKTIICKAMATASKGGSAKGDGKQYTTGTTGYMEDIHVKLQCEERLSKRWRITNIKSSDGENIFIEPDKIDLADTIFDIVSNHPVLDPLGKIAYYEINLRRAQVQNNDIIAV